MRVHVHNRGGNPELPAGDGFATSGSHGRDRGARLLCAGALRPRHLERSTDPIESVTSTFCPAAGVTGITVASGGTSSIICG